MDNGYLCHDIDEETTEGLYTDNPSMGHMTHGSHTIARTPRQYSSATMGHPPHTSRMQSQYNSATLGHASHTSGKPAYYNSATMGRQHHMTHESGLYSDSPDDNYVTQSLRNHKKRPSYHMMQQNYEDTNLVSQI